MRTAGTGGGGGNGRDGMGTGDPCNGLLIGFCCPKGDGGGPGSFED